jgi:hypothetical protein
MERDEESRSGTANWVRLAPRWTTRSEIVAVIGGEPKRFPGAMCVACDTRLGDELCAPDSVPGQVMELRHWAEPEFGLLRPSELKLLLS